jgi:hypothetical protein
MRKKNYKTSIFILLFFFASSCSSWNTQVYEVTRVVPQTVIVTLIESPTVPKLVVPRQGIIPTPRPYIDLAYYNGIVTITRYYTYLGHDLPGEAYKLLSSYAKKHNSEQEYVDMQNRLYESIKIVTIQPYFAWAKEHNSAAVPDIDRRKRFAAEIITSGDGKSFPQTFYLTLILENGEWKIDEFATAMGP